MDSLTRHGAYWQFIKSRTPAWANLAKIKGIYNYSKWMGTDYCVDHVVPLCSPYVCGLHCEDNLKIIRVQVNARKSNLFWPDMFCEQISLCLLFKQPVQLSLL